MLSVTFTRFCDSAPGPGTDPRSVLIPAEGATDGVTMASEAQPATPAACGRAESGKGEQAVDWIHERQWSKGDTPTIAMFQQTARLWIVSRVKYPIRKTMQKPSFLALLPFVLPLASPLIAADPTPPAAVASSPASDDVHKQLADVKDELSTALRSYSLLQDENSQLKEAAEKDAGDKAVLAAKLDNRAQDTIASLEGPGSRRSPSRTAEDPGAAVAGPDRGDGGGEHEIEDPPDTGGADSLLRRPACPHPPRPAVIG